MDACHADIDERGEPVAMLFASEGGIYERFGYGVATRIRIIEIATAEARLRPAVVPPPGSVRFVRGDEASDHVAATWERYRRSRPGEVTHPVVWHDTVMAMRSQERDGDSPAWYLRHDDGYAIYRIKQSWGAGRPAHTLELLELVAVTPEAHVALWHVLLNIDLVASITTRQMPLDDPLPYLLTNPRVVRTTTNNDGVWVNVRDLATCFGARAYRTDDRLVVEVDSVRWAIDGSPDGASVSRVRTRPDLVAEPDAIGPLLLGGVPATALAGGRRLTARNDEALRRADAFFGWPVAPMSQTYY
jgi:predicted acetyltransferase